MTAYPPLHHFYGGLFPVPKVNRQTGPVTNPGWPVGASPSAAKGTGLHR
jgi:hypothetical protein